MATTFNGSTLVYVCDQEQIIESIIKPMITKENSGRPEVGELAAAISGGICYMLSVEWQRLIRNGGDWQNFCNIFDNKEKIHITDRQLAYYKQIAANFQYYMSLHDGALARDIQSVILEKNIENCSGWFIDSRLVPLCLGSDEIAVKQIGAAVKSAGALANSIRAYFEGHSKGKFLMGIYGSYTASSGDTEHFGHEAAWAAINGTVYFFDCNYGLYEVRLKELNAFIMNYWTTYGLCKAELTSLG